MKYYLHYDNESNVIGYSTMPVSNPEFVCKEVSQEEYELFVEKKNQELELQELNEQRKFKIRQRLEQLSQDFVQAMAGAYFEDLEVRKAEFQTLHNELRVLEGKEPREYNTQNSLTNT